jgi:S-adenosyl-L-methionine hydrolase (adenosine-forming)
MIVTLLTDFGVADYFAGAMKGAVLSVNPRAQVVDITHEIPAHDIESAAFTLFAAYESFPAGTVHVAVVDPGVGSPRRPLVVSADGHLFVGPDNGVFGYVCERAPEPLVFHATEKKYSRPSASTTFHGRDVFAPLAGALSRGVEPATLGPPVADYVKLSFPAPRRLPTGALEGSIIHVDRFGNCVTNIAPADIGDEEGLGDLSVGVGEHEVRARRRFFAEETSAGGEPFIILGSAGLLEIAVYLDSAARLLDLRRGQKVRVQSSKFKVQSWE